MSTFHVFRQAANAQELAELLRLRYQVYRDCHLSRFVKASEQGIDIDAWDLHSRHFGLFRIDGESETVVGYMRVVEEGRTPAAVMVEEVASGYSQVLSRITRPLIEPFPLIKYFPDRKRVADYYRCLRKAGERLVEPGRLSLLGAARNRRLGKHMIESAIAVYFFTYGIENAMWGCIWDHSPMYRRYGCKPLSGTEVSDFAGIGEDSCVVHGAATGVPLRVRRRLTDMATAYRTTGCINYHSAAPGRFGALQPLTVNQPAVAVA